MSLLSPSFVPEFLPPRYALLDVHYSYSFFMCYTNAMVYFYYVRKRVIIKCSISGVFFQRVIVENFDHKMIKKVAHISRALYNFSTCNKMTHSVFPPLFIPSLPPSSNEIQERENYGIITTTMVLSSSPQVATFAFPAVNPLLTLAVTNAAQMTTVAASTASYVTLTNLLYIARRSNIRKMSKRKLWKIRTTREPGVSFRLFIIMLLSWQAFVFIFPVVELAARCFSQVSFFYTYPNAGGVGVILEPLKVQHMKQNKRAKHQIRFDWHRFNLNVGGIGRDGYRHPPKTEMNAPHLDIPKLGMKHWPWRRRYKVIDHSDA